MSQAVKGAVAQPGGMREGKALSTVHLRVFPLGCLTFFFLFFFFSNVAVFFVGFLKPH